MNQVSALYPPGTAPAPGSAHERYVADRLAEVGRWGTDTLVDRVRRHAVAIGERPAFVTGTERVSWRQLDDLSDRLAAVLLRQGLARGERVGVLLPDGVLVHVAYLAALKAGVVVVAVGPRAGRLEVRHLLTVSGATALISLAEHRGSPAAELVEGLPLTVRLELPATLADVGWPAPTDVERRLLAGRTLGLGEIHLLNGTSGTTGMPKCVVHNQNRWMYYHHLAVEAGALTGDDVFLTLIPAPYGFAQWTANFTPTLLGAPTVVMPRFSAAGALELIERERVTVLCCVSTQFIMMLNADPGRYDLSSLRCMFTGGEAVPFARAADFERRTGAQVLQFFGSNETGALSRTTVDDGIDARLRTAGRVIEEMRVRLLAEDGTDVTATGGPGQAACAGPATCLGYFADPEANEHLFTPDGWMLTGDICTADERGYLRVVDRKQDFIIRGGKNVSAAAVEDQVGTHPAVALVAAVAVPDPTYGERVCAVVVPHPGATLDLDGLRTHLADRGVSPENWPERLELVDELPRGSGGKIAKAELRARLRTG
ncbi:class I adenylate-forming enzyme family protein [Micromonospora sp. DSM 115977]|uniref:Class I adenylate-forming enzyme family protein n=1 Tax=Micromonospora reichwaldensis TaxID=3075516 RepID=A0ABU2WZV1_9ACTN|nr:class I adenylate-forming enzyme family protein [Micromonospora sp. DSM 115977]MDT0530557.1 class I adenylate-forming enzyme family protein [Micromonospora sp. DSM 115977]